MNILILQEKDLLEDNVYTVNDDRLTHLLNILKSEQGDIVEIGLLNGPTGTAEIIKIDETESLLKIIKLNVEEKSSFSVDIICALPRPQTLKKVLNTSATMGVKNLYLIRSEKVEKSYFHSPLLDEKNYTKFLIEGLSQGKRTNIPKVSIHKRFKVFFDNDFAEIVRDADCILAHPESNNYLSRELFPAGKKIVIAIGPEGGWNSYETKYMEERGFRRFKLSSSILRVENAVTASLSQIEMLLS